MAQSDWHLLEVEAALQRLNTSDAGLSSAGVEERVAGYGENNIPEGRHRSLLNMLLPRCVRWLRQRRRCCAMVK